MSHPVIEDICEVVMLKRGTRHREFEGKRFRQYLATTVATLGGFCAGCMLAWTSPSLPKLTSPDSEIPISAEEGSWIGCLLSLGAFIGALPAGIYADKIGRKNAMISIAIPFVISWVLIIFARSVIVLYVARIIAGLAVGSASVVVPIYVGEVASSNIRGTLGSFFQLQITLGILFMYVFGTFLDYLWLAIASSIVPIIFFVGLFFMPETPYYLCLKNRRGITEKSLLWLRGAKFSFFVNSELHSIEQSVLKSRMNSVGVLSALKSMALERACRRASIAVLGLMLFQQLSGINCVIFYTVWIFEAAGSTLSPNIATIIVGLVQVVATIASILLVDRAGRRILLLISSAIMAVCLAALGIHFYFLQIGKDMSSFGLIPLASLVVYIISYSLGFGPIPWVMLGEVLPSHIKGAAGALACVENYMFCFLVTKFFSNLLGLLGSAYTFWLFAGICIVGTIFVYFMVPETKGKKLEDIHKELAR